MQFGELAHGFFVKGLRCGRLVEVKVTAEHLVCTFAAEYHLDAMLLMTRASRYMGVEARTVVMS